MTVLKNRQFKTAIKADADIHAGGNFFWKTYYEKLIFKDNNRVELVRVLLKENGTERLEETLLSGGVFKNPTIGYYDVEIELNHVNQKVLTMYCGKIVEPKTLICHGYVTSPLYDGSQYKTEIFIEINV